MEIDTILFGHREGKFSEISYIFHLPSEMDLTAVKEQFSRLEEVLNQVYSSLDYEKRSYRQVTHDLIKVGVEYGKSGGPSLTGAIAGYTFNGLTARSFKIDISISTRGPEEQLLQIYDGIMAVRDVTTSPGLTPVIERIKLLRKGKQGEELLAALRSG